MLLERLERQSRLSRGQLEQFAITASKRYKIYNIPKRNGGERQIEQPSRAIKAIQRWLNLNLIRKFPIHISSTAYNKGSSILRNAEFHKNTNFTVRIDFEDYFPSFRDNGIERFLQENRSVIGDPLDDNDISFIRNIVCRHGRLTIGAPSSPLLTNAIMFQFDGIVYQFCQSRGLVYTRYADDIFISATRANSLGDVADFVASVSTGYPYANLTINCRKTVFLSKKYRRVVTGMVITPQGSVSVGRNLKDEVRSGVYKFKNGIIDGDEIARIRGLVAYIYGVEPSFLGILERKYGDETIGRLLGGRPLVK
ncbi:retron St85 family RNA-directed DNA polymerase [Blastochloris tepida]|nr:retron St85 family RNA-directed DNA polymerase [Blastochloris tepida]